MTLLKSLIIRTARRLASDPAARAQAADLAKKARPAIDGVVREARAMSRSGDPAYDLGRLAGRLKRKYLEGE